MPYKTKAGKASYMRRWRMSASGKEQGLRAKKEAIKHYGGKCYCCGESRLPFLTLDHKKGGGRKERMASERTGRKWYWWLKKQGWPEGLQVACWSCNCGRQVNGGICPHQDLAWT